MARGELRLGAALGAYLLAVLPTLGFVQHGGQFSMEESGFPNEESGFPIEKC